MSFVTADGRLIDDAAAAAHAFTQRSVDCNQRSSEADHIGRKNK